MKSLLIYNNNYTVAVGTALVALGAGAKKKGYEVFYGNPQPFQPGSEEKVDAVILYGDSDLHKLIKKCYAEKNIEVIDVTKNLLSFTTLQHESGESIQRILKKPEPEFFDEAEPEPEEAKKKAGRPKTVKK